MEARQEASAPALSFQDRVAEWVRTCFGIGPATDPEVRNHRFLEEALELYQSGGGTAEDAHLLVDYVFGRPVGDLRQEVGGVMLTLAALCSARDANLEISAEAELARVWTKIPQIRAKQAAKPKFGPLPGPSMSTCWRCLSAFANEATHCPYCNAARAVQSMSTHQWPRDADGAPIDP